MSAIPDTLPARRAAPPAPRARVGARLAVVESACPEDLPPDLRYVDDCGPGLSRRLIDGHFAYFDAAGRRIRDAADIKRINALAIPPAYVDVWICPDPRGHLQATGRDARGRKQYRYHPRWRESRDANKYERLLAFGMALPRIRARVARDLGRTGLPREKVLATVVRLLDTTLIRVGNAGYARDNQSYGLTTLRNRHVAVRAGEIRFRFRGKSGIAHDVKVHDRRVAAIVKRCMDLPGHDLFQYLDEQGEAHTVSSSDINAYLQQITGAGFSAKDYRTWAGSVCALAELRTRAQASAAAAVDPAGPAARAPGAATVAHSAAETRRQVVDTIKQVARRLGNTPAVCRKCYVHPAVIEAFETGELAAPPRDKAGSARGLKADEAALAAFLRRAARRAARSARQAAAKLG